jgi:rSAM/selenodomain-associated transferase 1
MMKYALIIFQKNAVLGKVKTRLAVSVGDEKALEIYNWLTERTHLVAKELPVDKFLFFSDFLPQRSDYPSQFFIAELQSGSDLGERMSRAFEFLFSKGYEKVVIIGTDCPSVTSTQLKTAFRSLETAELVIGPATDGGYYLMGMNQFYPGLFESIPWSTDQVLELTLDIADKLGLEYDLLSVLSDIDTLDDWKKFTEGNSIVL